MRVLVINPIMYTSETKQIHRAESIQDTMMYDLCLAFCELGHQVTLIGGEPFKPVKEENYPFEVQWWACRWQKLFMPHCLPFMPKTFSYVKKNEYDLILTSEVFSVNSLMAYLAAPQKTIIWHELAKHNAIMKQIPSKIWYHFVARIFMRRAKVVARSEQARDFVRQFCKNTDDRVVDHGVNLDKFRTVGEKTDSFVVCSQLIARKRIDGILKKFAAYLKKWDAAALLYIIGNGELEEELKALTKQYGIERNVIYTGRQSHEELLPRLAQARALLVNTIKDNNMVSIVESIAVGTPVVTTDVPLNAAYIREYGLGIAKPEWDEDDLKEIVANGGRYVQNCLHYRERLSTKERVRQLLEIQKEKRRN